MSKLDRIIKEGNRVNVEPYDTYEERQNASIDSKITCKDGFVMSVIAGYGAYSTHNGAIYTHLEVGFPSERPEPWEAWAPFCEDTEDPTGTVYVRVPAVYIRTLIGDHGGEEDEGVN